MQFFKVVLKYSGIIFLLLLANHVEALTTLPIKFGTMPGDLARPFIQAQTQKQTLSLLFDSGFATAEIALDESELKNIKVTWTHTKTCSENYAGKKKCWKNFILPSLKLGNTTIRAVNGVEFSDKHMNSLGIESAANGGILGLPLIKKFNVQLNYPKSSISLYQYNENNNSNQNHHGKNIRFTMHNGVIETSELINNKKIPLAWDTGAVSSLNENVIPQGLQSSCPVSMSPKILCYKTKAGDAVNFRGAWFYILPLFSSKMPFKGFVGSQFFHKHVVTFDFKKQLITID